MGRVIEASVFSEHSHDSSRYTSAVRALIAEFRRNPSLLARLKDGALDPSKLGSYEPSQLNPHGWRATAIVKSDQRNRERALQIEKDMRAESTPDKPYVGFLDGSARLACPRCHSKNTQFAETPAAEFTCLDCKNKWYL
jgi:hypothetical protein